MKYLKPALILSIAQLFSPAIAGTINYKDYNEVSNKVSSEIKYLFRQYSSKKILHAEILDTYNQTIKSFLNSATQRKSDHLLAMQYFPQFKINNAETSFCFIFYDSKNNIFENYKNAKIFEDDEEIFSYLTWHEMGHCFAYHDGFIKNPRADEFVADAFAISIAMNKKQFDFPEKILKFIGTLKESENHANQFHLNKFYQEAINNNLYSRSLSINEILQMIFYYYEDYSLTGFNFK